MSDESPRSGDAPEPLPDTPSLEWLRKRAKARLRELRVDRPDARLADAQLDLARRHGFPSWRALKAHVDALGLDGELVAAARGGDVETLARRFDEQPALVERRFEPYACTLLHHAAQAGQLGVVDLLLARGLDANAKEKGDRTSAMHWAAAGGQVAIVQRLIDAGGDVVGAGDDHELEVIGWATCWDGTDDDAHRAVVDLLLAHGARHHIFSAIAMNLADEVRRLIAADPAVLGARMSRNESHRGPLHHAVRMNRPDIVTLLLSSGADAAATDDGGLTAVEYAAAPDVDARILDAFAARGVRSVFVALAIGDDALAERLLTDGGDAARGALHLAAKRGDARAVRWLLAHGVDPNVRWGHWDAEVTALHLAAAEGHTDVVQALLAAGGDPAIRDSKHDGDAAGWAEYGRRPPAANWREMVALLEAHTQ